MEKNIGGYSLLSFPGAGSLKTNGKSVETNGNQWKVVEPDVMMINLSA